MPNLNRAGNGMFSFANLSWIRALGIAGGLYWLFARAGEFSRVKDLFWPLAVALPLILPWSKLTRCWMQYSTYVLLWVGTFGLLLLGWVSFTTFREFGESVIPVRAPIEFGVMAMISLTSLLAMRRYFMGVLAPPNGHGGQRGRGAPRG